MKLEIAKMNASLMTDAWIFTDPPSSSHQMNDRLEALQARPSSNHCRNM